MKNKVSKFTLVVIMAFAFYACKKNFLDINPQGSLDEATLGNERGLNKILLGAYAMLDGHDGGLNIGGNWGSSGSNFVFGSMAGGEANRGSSIGDQCPNMCPAIKHTESSTNGALNDRWIALYEGIKRANTVIQLLNKVKFSVDATGKKIISDEVEKSISGQARALRAWYHFQAKITFGKIAYIDEKIDSALSLGTVQGVTNEGNVYPQILADAKYAYENTPALQDAKGKINKWVAGAIYGKILMFNKDFTTAKTVLTDVVNNGTTPGGVKFDLNVNFEDNFNVATENSSESIFAFQSSAQDNAGARNSNWGDNLNTPGGGSGLGGAGFFTPTYYFVNSFKTDALGLPVANPQNKDVIDTAGVDPANHQQVALGYTLYKSQIDPRLDWTVGRNGVPFHDWGIYITSWQRDITAGPFAGKKIMIRKSQVAGFHDASIWFSAGGTALNVNLIRFSDVILLLAEAEIEVGSLPNAFALINRVRTRAKNSSKVKTYVDNTDPSKGFTTTDAGTYVVNPYPIVFTTQAQARTAVQLERLLELGMEGHRFFDLVRWGAAKQELDAFYTYESSIPYQKNGDLTPKPTYAGPTRDYYSVPQAQIDLGKGFLKP